jgi:predicted O-methyltransferase YrrM
MRIPNKINQAVKKIALAERTYRKQISLQTEKIQEKIDFYRFHLPTCSIDEIASDLDEKTRNSIINEQRNMPPRSVKWTTSDGIEINPTHDDIGALLRIVKTLNPKIVLELGTAYGNTTANICQISEAKIFTVNALPEQISGNVTTFALTKETIGSIYRQYGFQNRVIQIYENTLNLNLNSYFKTPCVDLAIVDACHDTEYVINDFIKVLPSLKDKAIVLLHDTHPSMAGHLKGSYKACMNLRKQGFKIKHIKDTWWAIWQKGVSTLN